MKKVLFAGLLAIAGVSVSAQNLIRRQVSEYHED